VYTLRAKYALANDYCTVIYFRLLMADAVDAIYFNFIKTLFLGENCRNLMHKTITNNHKNISDVK